ncbi:MAG: UbiA family prenyltransferase [Candidatus Syntropharchaeia archaeon]
MQSGIRLREIIALYRPLTSFMASLAVIASAFVGVGTKITSYSFPVLLASLLVFFFVAGGNALNDYMDRESDRINHPERPIPSGRIRPEEALQISIATFGIVISLAIVLTYFIKGFIPFFIAGIALFIQISYEKWLKKGFIGNFAISAQTGLLFIFGGSVVEKIEITGILAVLAFLAILGREIMKDVADVRGDVGRFTLPMRIGRRNACFISSFFIILAVLLSPLPYHLRIFGFHYLFIVLLADLILIHSVFFQFRNAELATRTAKVGMLIALVAFISGSLELSVYV